MKMNRCPQPKKGMQKGKYCQSSQMMRMKMQLGKEHKGSCTYPYIDIYFDNTLKNFIFVMWK